MKSTTGGKAPQSTHRFTVWQAWAGNLHLSGSVFCLQIWDDGTSPQDCLKIKMKCKAEENWSQLGETFRGITSVARNWPR